MTIKIIIRYNIQTAEAIQDKNLKLVEKLKCELISLESALKKSYFGIADNSINDLYDLFIEAKFVEFFVNQSIKTQENKDASSNNSRMSVKDNTLRLPNFE